jgi:hypothetical protein
MPKATARASARAMPKELISPEVHSALEAGIRSVRAEIAQQPPSLKRTKDLATADFLLTGLASLVSKEGKR